MFRKALIAILTLGTVLLAYAALIEPRWVKDTRLTVASSGWPKSYPPLRIAFIADIHVGSPFWDLAAVEDTVARINALRPDLVVLGGDFIGSSEMPFGGIVPPEPIAARLANLRAPLGVIAVLGNHDNHYGPARVTRALRQAGITVLENAAVGIEVKGLPVLLAGLSDDTTTLPQARRAYIARLFSQPREAPLIILTHDPGIFTEIPPQPALILAAHTHGGQVNIPFYGPPFLPSRAPRRHAYGLIREAGKTMYVTSGLSTSILPIRFNARPEIALIELRSNSPTPKP